MTALAIGVYPEPGKIEAALLAILVHAALFALLFFGVQWQITTPETVSVELWEKASVAEPIPPVPVPTIAPEIKPEPPPEPAVDTKAEVKPEREPLPKPITKAVPKPDIALKAKLEKKKQEELKKRDEQQKLDTAKRIQAEREQTLKEQREKLRKESQLLQAQNEAAREESRLNAQRAAANRQAFDEYVNRIRSKIRSNIVIPEGIVGNPEAVFDVVQLPGGDILTPKLRTSSGNKAYDDAVERAILKSSPLPKPSKPELFQRELTLKFRPRDNN
jgi:colicin import membrane protein